MVRHRVAAVAEVEPDTMKRVEVEGVPICLAHAEDGEVYALNEPPARGDSRKIDDDGNAAQAIVEFLAEKRLV